MEKELKARVLQLFQERGGGNDATSRQMFEDSWTCFLLWKKEFTRARKTKLCDQCWANFSERKKSLITKDLVSYLFYNTPLFH